MWFDFICGRGRRLKGLGCTGTHSRLREGSEQIASTSCSALCPGRGFRLVLEEKAVTLCEIQATGNRRKAAYRWWGGNAQPSLSRFSWAHLPSFPATSMAASASQNTVQKAHSLFIQRWPPYVIEGKRKTHPIVRVVNGRSAHAPLWERLGLTQTLEGRRGYTVGWCKQVYECD